MSSTGKLIILEGLPGVGKTLFGKSYASVDPNSVFLEEWVDIKVLKEYLADMKNKAADFQMHIQKETVQRIQKAIQLVHEGKTVLLDRGLIGNRCFAEVQFEAGLISEDSMKSYRSEFTYTNIEGFWEIDSEIIYMKATPEFSLQRIKKRAREGENVYELTYLQELKNKHDNLLQEAKVVHVEIDHDLTDSGELPLVAVHAILVN